LLAASNSTDSATGTVLGDLASVTKSSLTIITSSSSSNNLLGTTIVLTCHEIHSIVMLLGVIASASTNAALINRSKLGKHLALLDILNEPRNIIIDTTSLQQRNNTNENKRRERETSRATKSHDDAGNENRKVKC
jgi:exosortase/archaeosortase